MVMEFLDGHDLGALLDERGSLSVPWATEMALQAAEALAEAHSIGIVHRDVKPTNLFVTWRPDGSALIKVLDFGISKSPIGTDMQLTQTQSLLGTPAYMSPEQMRSARLVDARSDIWSLGTVLYEVLEGRRPFEAESFSEMCVKVAVDPPAPMVNTPPALQPVILRCLAKTPEQRYQTMAELGRDLMGFAQDPHQAQVLVERMQRMARRSAADWEGPATGTGAPHAIRDPGSAPRAAVAPAWHGGSDPAVQPWHGGSDPVARPWQGADSAAVYPPAAAPGQVPHQGGGSAPVPRIALGAPSTAHTMMSRPRRWPLVAGIIGVLAAAGIALGLYAASREDTSTTANVGGSAQAGSAIGAAPQPTAGSAAPLPSAGSSGAAPAGSGADLAATGSGADLAGSGDAGSAAAAAGSDHATAAAGSDAAEADAGSGHAPSAPDAHEVRGTKHGHKRHGSNPFGHHAGSRTHHGRTEAASTNHGQHADDAAAPKAGSDCDPFGHAHDCKH
jgi:serine/threonine-protein kinase